MKEEKIGASQTNQTADVNYPEGGSVTLPIVHSTEGERALDISSLRQETGFTTLDPGFGNTAETPSSITYINGEQGVLRYRGYPLEQLTEHGSFLEVAYLLFTGELPTTAQLEDFHEQVTENALGMPEGLSEKLSAITAGVPHIQSLAASTLLLRPFYADTLGPSAGGGLDPQADWRNMVRLFAQLPIMAAHIFRSVNGMGPVMCRPDLSYASNLLHMMFSNGPGYQVSENDARVMDILLILHADHGQNLSTSAVRLVGSGQANLFSVIAAGILALSAPLHGGANQRVVAMLEEIMQEGGDPAQSIARAKDRSNPFRLMGFGHRVYRNFDPRASIIKQYAQAIMQDAQDPLLELALQLEQEALADDYFIDRQLYPNVDFYSGIIYRALGFPVDMFTVLFALGRLPGWLAQWYEMVNKPGFRIQRPRQIYQGYLQRDYAPIEQR